MAKKIEMNELTRNALARFVETVNAALVTYYASHYKHVEPSVLELDEGLKYVRVWSVSHGSRSAYCFVDKTTGEVFKPDGWKKPAKHARGTVFAPNVLNFAHPHGIVYLNGPNMGW
jgi:hypothetical protein